MKNPTHNLIKTYVPQNELIFSPIGGVGQIGMNFYLYGPKEDKYNRAKWFEPYPVKEIENFKNFFNKSKKHNIKSYISISPGQSYVEDNESEFKNLTNKIDKFLEAGFSNFAILLDFVVFDFGSL